MSADFDPYHQWLGIPPDEQPPNYYRLLGIRELEPDRGVITNAADRQMSHLRSFQSGHHAALSQKLLNEVSAAKMCLLNPERKAAYDAELNVVRTGVATPVPPPPPEAPPLPGEIAGPSAGGETDAASRTTTRKRKLIFAATGGLAVVVVAVVVAAMAGVFSKDEIRQVAEPPTDVEPIDQSASVANTNQDTPPAEVDPEESPAETAASENHPPVLDAVASQSVRPETLLRVRLSARDADVPKQTLTFELVSGPSGARVDPVRGDFFWQPAVDESHLEFRTTVAVSDGAGGRDVTTFLISVRADEGELKLAADAAEPGANDSPPTTPESIAADPPPPKPDLQLVARDLNDRHAAADTDSALHALLYDTLKLLDDTCRESRYDLAEQTARALHEAVKRAGAESWNQPFLLLVSQLKSEQSGWKSIEEPLQRLKTDPDDVAANAAVGRWHGLHQGDWALPYLAKAADPKLTDLSSADLAADSTKPAVCAARGDAWWIAALTTVPAERDMLMIRAGRWYRRIPSPAGDDLLSPEQRRRLQDAARAEQRRTHPFVALWDRFPKNEAASLEAAAIVTRDVARDADLDTRHCQLALAARLLQLVDETTEKDKQRAILLDAELAAANQGDPLLTLAAVDRLEEVAGCWQFDKKCQAVTQSIAKTRFVSPTEAQAAVNACLDLMPLVDDKASFDALLGLFGGVQRLVRKFSDDEFNEWADQQRQVINTRYELFTKAEDAAAKLANAGDDLQPADAAFARLDVARYHGLCNQDWTAVLPLLGESSSAPLSRAAQKILDADADAGAKREMADAWWDLSVAELRDPQLKSLLRVAALYWYGEALPGAAGADYDEVQRRLSVGFGEEVEDQPITRLSVALRGLAGRTYMRSGNSNSILIENGRGGITGRGGFAFGTVPATSYVHDFEIGFLEEYGSLSMNYGEGQGCRIQMEWSELERKFVCRLEQYADDDSQWDGDHQFDAQRKISLTLYVAADRQWLFHDGKKILEAKGPASDLRFSVFAEDNTAVSMFRCEFRPFNSSDAARLGVAMPADEPSETVTSTEHAVIAVYARNLGLPDRPMLKRPEPFVVATTETPMTWIKPGTFFRKYGFDAATPTKVTMTKGFWIGRYEITRAEWSRVTGKPISLGESSPLAPVRRVDWRDAMKFCSLLTQQEKKSRRIPEGYEYRLPTEAEWEMTCRAGETADWSVEADHFWHSQTAAGRPRDVGQSAANAWGLFDMHGNVAEWCFDRYTPERFTPPEVLIDPVEVPASPNDPFVIRGGAWTMDPDQCSSRARSQSRAAGRPYVGFRIALAPVAPRPQPKPTPQKKSGGQRRDRDRG